MGNIFCLHIGHVVQCLQTHCHWLHMAVVITHSSRMDRCGCSSLTVLFVHMFNEYIVKSTRKYILVDKLLMAFRKFGLLNSMMMLEF